MGWQQVLDDQLDIYRWLRTPQGEQAMKAFEESVLKQNDEKYSSKVNLGYVEQSKFYLADPMYISDEMQQLIEVAAESFKPEPLQPSDLPTTYGFAVFPRPFCMNDSHDRQVTFRAFAWMPVIINNVNNETGKETTSEGIHISYYCHRDDMDLDDYGKEFGKWLVNIPYSLLHYTPWRFNEEAPTTGIISTHLEWWTIVQTFFRISMQYISDRYQQKPPRAATKRWQREKSVEKKDRYITVIKLRRPKHSNDEEPQKVDWKHRWIVEGFWRNQWFPSLNTHRQIYINSYVKGPESKPLLIRKGRAFEVVR